MANKHGGYRKPAKPAPVSGPGRLSKRTDGRPGTGKQVQAEITGLGYGENKELNEQQTKAPLAASTATPGAMPSMPAIPGPSEAALPEVADASAPALSMDSLSSIFAPTARPTEPLTAGVDFGPGAGSEVLPGTPNYEVSQQDQQKLQLLYGIMMNAASQPNASQATKELARKIRSAL